MEIKEEKMKGLLYSCIGYDTNDIKKIMIRNTDNDYDDQLCLEIVSCKNGVVILKVPFVYWGEKWKSNWWIADFTEINIVGEYWAIAKLHNIELFRSDRIEIGSHILYNKSFEKVALEQFEQRAKLARNSFGWKDCGGDFREANSHASAIIGLSDYYSMDFESMTKDQTQRMLKQICIGCDYLVLLQDKATQIGFPLGAVIHDIPKYMEIVLGDVAQFVVAMAKASKIITEYDFSKSGKYLECAVNAMNYLLESPPIRQDRFNHWNHGADENYQPPNEIMTRDLLMMLWGCLELYTGGKLQFKENMFQLARNVIERQVMQNEKEFGYYGHFFTFSDRKFTEKANCHHHVCMDTGSVFPHYIVPIMELCEYFPEHQDNSLWKSCILDFAFGYFLPACTSNPFKILPMGVFKDGLLDFCGPWHGANVSLGWAAVLALRLEMFTGNKCFREIAIGNLQWIAGLNSGITKESLIGCVKWYEKLEEDQILCMSQIQDVGTKTVQVWSRIPGSFANGFSANVQFEHKVKPCLENDMPRYFADEDWITHIGGFLVALAYLKMIKSWSPF